MSPQDLSPQELFSHYTPLAGKSASTMYKKLHYGDTDSFCNTVTYDELRGAALVGLWKACEKWDPDKGKFSTHAHCLCWNAMIDWMRAAHKDDRYFDRIGKVRPLTLSLDEVVEGPYGPTHYADLLICPKSNHTEEIEQKDEIETTLKKKLKSTSRILRSYYLEEKNAKQIGKEMGVHYDWVRTVLRPYRERREAAIGKRV